VSVSGTLAIFGWFLWQASIVGGLGAAFFWIPFLLLVAAVSWAFVHAVADRRKLWLLVLLPMTWIFVGLWGAAFERAGLPNPTWATYPITTALLVYLAITAILIWYLRGAFLLTSLFAVLNLYFLFAMMFLASMAVSGIWL
jgi:hypothetical protein